MKLCFDASEKMDPVPADDLAGTVFIPNNKPLG
jgi:hypothetical protein